MSRELAEEARKSREAKTNRLRVMRLERSAEAHELPNKYKETSGAYGLIGQLCRETYGDAAALIGFGTHRGTVAAATDWDGEMEIKPVRPSLEESIERCCHLSGKPHFLLDFSRRPDLADALSAERLERFIGVIYRPESERLSHYAQVELARQFDAYVWFDETRAIAPLPAETGNGRVPDTFPFGL